MILTPRQLSDFVEAIFSTVLKMPVTPAPADATVLGAGTIYRAQVNISGSWRAEVAIEANAPLCQKAAAAFYDCAAAEVDEEQQREALAELANMLGGSIKSLVPGENKISLPQVTSSKVFGATGSANARSYRLDCGGELLGVTITEA